MSPALQRLELFARDMRAFVQATAVIGLLNGVATGLSLWLLGIEFPLMWDAFAFITTFITMPGFFIAVLPLVFLPLVTAGWRTALLVLIGYIVIYAVPLTLPVRRMLVEAYDESRLITDLLGRPVGGAPPPPLSSGPGHEAPGRGA